MLSLNLALSLSLYTIKIAWDILPCDFVSSSESDQSNERREALLKTKQIIILQYPLKQTKFKLKWLNLFNFKFLPDRRQWSKKNFRPRL